MNGKAFRALPFAARAHATSLLLLGIIGLAFLLRLHRVAFQSWWWDEGYSVHLASQGVFRAIAITAGDFHPPLYYVLLSLWGTLAGYNELTTRLLSAFFATLLIPVTYRAGTEALGQKAGLLAATLAALAPAQVYYGQETRMYALFTLQSALLLLVSGRLLRSPRWSIPALAATSAVEASMAYTHYFSAIAIAVLNLIVVVNLLRQPRAARSQKLRGWLLSQVAALAAYAPWLPVVLGQVGRHVDERTLSPTPLDFFTSTWHFFNVGVHDLVGTNTAVAQRTALVSSIFGVILLAALLLAALARWRSLTPWHGFWLGVFVLPWVTAFALTQLKPTFHPRYLLMTTPALLLLIAALAQALMSRTGRLDRISRGLGMVLVLASIGNAFHGLWVVYYEERFHREDLRGVGYYLRAVSTSQDAVIVDDEDYTLRQYYPGPASLHTIKTYKREAASIADVQKATADKRRVFLVHWFRAISDDKRLFPFLLERAGLLTAMQEFRGYTLQTYELEQPVALPTLRPVSIHFDGQCELIGTFVEPQTHAGEGVAVALRWRTRQAIPDKLKASVTLLDADRQRLSSTDWPLMNDSYHYTDRWAVGEETNTYFVVAVPLGTPPGTYTLTLTLYREPDLKGLNVLDQAGNPSGQSIPLGTVEVLLPRLNADPYSTMAAIRQLDTPLGIAEGVQLLGFQLDPVTLAPGEALRAQLLLQAQSSSLTDQPLSMEIRRGATVLGEQRGAPGYGHYPLSRWVAGVPVVDRRVVWVAPNAEPGPAEVRLRVGEGKWHPLGTVAIAGRPRRFTAPSFDVAVGQRFLGLAELVGVSLSSTVLQRSEALEARLVWRALNTSPVARPHVVSVQVLNSDGRLVGQSDQPPAAGASPTTSWVAGEFVEDVHKVSFREPLVGEGRLIVVLYDSETMVRVQTEDGQDHIALPIQLHGK